VNQLKVYTKSGESSLSITKKQWIISKYMYTQKWWNI